MISWISFIRASLGNGNLLPPQAEPKNCTLVDDVLWHDFAFLLLLTCLISFSVYINAEKVLMMLGKVQFELQKLVDRYVSVSYCHFNAGSKFCYLVDSIHFSPICLQRSHIFITITNPSESLLSELQTVQVCHYCHMISV